eukprot:TRINITY_DN16573_c0_g1_i2.p1 TRINITY_DN16573_c0_g1~~TRINITY_DN16573_c0_g1_i2.p1  ORF type:complete len:257 (+),score=93.69 TRINITY_DN16573_c0_g1_i2:85-771(+)
MVILKCSNPECQREIKDTYIMVRPAGAADESPVCNESCKQVYYNSVAPDCEQCKKKMLGGYSVLELDGREVKLCSDECADRFQDGLRPDCAHCGKKVPQQYVTISLPGQEDQGSKPVCDQACFDAYEKKMLGDQPPPIDPQSLPPPDVVVVFGRDTCGTCHSCKDELKGAGIRFEERDIDTDKGYRDLLWDSGFSGGEFDLPVVTFKGKAYWLEKDAALVAALRSAGA